MSAPKEHSIREVVARLRAHFGPSAFVLADHWNADHCAIGISVAGESERLAYISTYDKPPGRYFLSLERPRDPGSEFPYESAGDRDDLDFEQLASLIAQHLDLQPLRPAG